MDLVEQNTKIALEWIKAFNEHDLKKLLALYSDDAVHFSPKLKLKQPETDGWIKSKSSLQAWWADAFKRLPSLSYELTNLIVNDSQVLMEYLRMVESEAPFMVAEILEIENKLIVGSRVYHG